MLLDTLIKSTVGLVRDTYNLGETIVEGAVEEVSNIPQAIEDGWNEGLISSAFSDEEKEENKLSFKIED